MRAQVEKKMAQKEKEKKEEKLRELAQMARDRRAGIKSHGDKGESSKQGSFWRFRVCMVLCVGAADAFLCCCQFPIWNESVISVKICHPAALCRGSKL